jgi:hypothetical protein
MAVSSFKKQDAGVALAAPADKAPETVAPELFETYRLRFREHMSTIAALSAAEVVAMEAFICDGVGGHLDQARYRDAVFEMYFKGREWRWPELEAWRGVAREIGCWPTQWSDKEKVDAARAEALSTREDEALNRQRYDMLMQWIQYGATSIEAAQRCAAAGMVRRPGVMAPIQTDQPLVDYALRQNPAALTPLFPGDVSMVRHDAPK